MPTKEAGTNRNPDGGNKQHATPSAHQQGRVAKVPMSQSTPRRAQPNDSTEDFVLLCLNCDKPIEEPRNPYLYCCELCKEEAKYVRYYRAVIADGRIHQRDVKEAIETRLAMILGGGYPGRARALSPQVRAAIIERDAGRCRICGAKGEEIDHIRAHEEDVNHPDNLQLLCASCHAKKTQAGYRVVTRESDPIEWRRCQKIASALEHRIHAMPPERLCDDESAWTAGWRSLAKQRGEAWKQATTPQ